MQVRAHFSEWGLLFSEGDFHRFFYRDPVDRLWRRRASSAVPGVPAVLTCTLTPRTQRLDGVVVADLRVAPPKAIRSGRTQPGSESAAYSLYAGRIRALPTRDEASPHRCLIAGSQIGG